MKPAPGMQIPERQIEGVPSGMRVSSQRRNLLGRLPVRHLIAVFAVLLGIGFGVPSAHANSRYAALVIHADTGDVLFSRYATGRRYPASLTKMMTLYLLFEEIEAGRLAPGSKLKTSRRASHQPASRLGLKLREELTVDQAIRALIIKSANDVAVVVAEHISSSEMRFARKMTQKARALGMRATTFKNASGLPNRQQVSTAQDLAVLSQRIVQDFPQYSHYFQLESFIHKGKTHKSHNKLVKSYRGANGLKTGYTRLSGYNLSTTVQRGEHRLIGIVLGGRTSKSRNAHMEKILDAAFTHIAQKPSLLKASFLHRPIPRLKNETLDALGGVWPPVNPAPGGNTLVAARGNERYSAWPDRPVAAVDAVAATADDLNFRSLEQALLSNPLHNDTGSVGEGDFAPVSAPVSVAVKPSNPWGIQTGAYRTLPVAEKHAADTRDKIKNIAPNLVEDVSEVINQTKTLYRIRFLNLTEKEADEACAKIIASGGDCFSLKDRSLSD